MRLDRAATVSKQYARCVEVSKRVRWEIDRDVFLYHWREESQHAIIDELEWRREDERLDEAGRDQGVDDLVALIAAVDGILQAQARADARYFSRICPRALGDDEAAALDRALLAAYRWQYIISGVQEPRFVEILGSLITPAQSERIAAGLAPMMN